MDDETQDLRLQVDDLTDEVARLKKDLEERDEQIGTLEDKITELIDAIRDAHRTLSHLA